MAMSAALDRPVKDEQQYHIQFAAYSLEVEVTSPVLCFKALISFNAC